MHGACHSAGRPRRKARPPRKRRGKRPKKIFGRAEAGVAAITDPVIVKPGRTPRETRFSPRETRFSPPR
jgi:hypothetical protein